MMRGTRKKGYKSMGKHLLDHLSKGDLFRILPAVIIGAEGENDGDGDKGGANGDGGDGDTKDSDKGGDDGDEDEDKDKDTAGLKSALAKERAAAKAATKELAKLKKAADDKALSEKSEIEQAAAKEKAATEKVTKLAAGLLQRDLEAAISKAAATSKFIDADDAIAGVDRSALVFTQDPDDPTDITIDYKTVEKAVKALASKKPHFIKMGTDDGEPTGSQFGGSKGKKPTNEEAIIARYPALQ